MVKWGTNSWDTEEMTSHKAGSSAVLNIALKREGRKRKKKREKVITKWVFVFCHPSRYKPCRTGLNFVERTRHGAVMLNAAFLLSKMRKGNREKKKSLILARKIKGKKMRGMKMRIITCFGDQTNSSTFFIIDSVYRTITSWMFSTVLHLLVYSLTIAFLHYFLTMPVGFNSNLTYRLNPQVSGIKVVTVYRRRSTFQVEWLIATLIPSGTTWFKCSCLRASLLTVLRLVYAIGQLNSGLRSGKTMVSIIHADLISCRYF